MKRDRRVRLDPQSTREWNGPSHTPKAGRGPHLHGVLRLADAVEVGQQGDRLSALERLVRGLVDPRGLVERQALVEGRRALHLLHHLHGHEQDAGSVVADHGLRQAVGLLGPAGGADLQSWDAHDVGVERLRVLGAERLVRSGSASADDGHGHVELAASGRVGVSGGADLGHAVDAKVGVHELDDRTVSVHSLSESLADEVALVDDLVRSAESAEGLLRQVRDGVARSGLQVLSVDDRARIAEHLLQDREVGGVSDGDAAVRSLLPEAGDVGLDSLEGSRLHRGLRERLAVGRRFAQVVVGIRGIRELQLLGEVGRGLRRVLGEVHGLLHAGIHARLHFVELLLGAHAIGKEGLLEKLDRVRIGAGPLLLLLAAALVLRIRRRVALEAPSSFLWDENRPQTPHKTKTHTGTHLKDGGTVGAHVVDHGAARLDGREQVLAVHSDARDVVVLPLLEDVHVGSDIVRERVDSAPCFGEEIGEETGRRETQLRLTRPGRNLNTATRKRKTTAVETRIEALGEAAVHGSSLAHEDDADAVIAGILLRLQVAVEQNRARRASSIRELLRHERPPSLQCVTTGAPHLKVRVLVVDVHGAASALAGTGFLHEELGHDLFTSVCVCLSVKDRPQTAPEKATGMQYLIRRHARGDGVAVLAVEGVLLVAHFDRVGHDGRDALLAVVKMHETADETLTCSVEPPLSRSPLRLRETPSEYLHVRLVAGVLEVARHLHRLVGLQLLGLGQLVVLGEVRDAERAGQLLLGLRPRDAGPGPHHWRVHQDGVRSDFWGRATLGGNPLSAARYPPSASRCKLQHERRRTSSDEAVPLKDRSDPPLRPKSAKIFGPKTAFELPPIFRIRVKTALFAKTCSGNAAQDFTAEPQERFAEARKSVDWHAPHSLRPRTSGYLKLLARFRAWKAAAEFTPKTHRKRATLMLTALRRRYGRRMLDRPGILRRRNGGKAGCVTSPEGRYSECDVGPTIHCGRRRIAAGQEPDLEISKEAAEP
eukprot:scaffold434_cov186-Pinguiococcus_pyrenoidosus.AAC.61